MRKPVIIIILLAAVGYVGWKYYLVTQAAASKQPSKPKTVAVETARIVRTDLADRVVFTGSIVAEERYDATAKIPGIIRQLNFKAGDIVNSGDILAILDDDEHVLAVEQAEAALKVAQANANDANSQLAITERDYERAQKLRKEQVISAQEFDRAEAAYKAQSAKAETAAAQVRLSEVALRTAKVRLGYTRIKAEWDVGTPRRVIGQRFLDVGALVNVNTPILSVLDINTVRAIIAVSEKDYPKITIGRAVDITTDAFRGRIFSGRVSRIPQELGSMTREAEVEIEIDNTALELKPGMFVRADIVFFLHTGVIAVPIEAVVRRDDGTRGVYLVNEKRDQASFQPITEGIVDGKLVELLDADMLLDREVVIMGQHLLKDGIGIRVAKAAADKP